MENLPKINLSPEEMKLLRDTPPKTKQELKDWSISFLDFYPFDTPIDDGNSSPMDFWWEIYKKCVLNQLDDDRLKILAVAGRGSQKTYTAGCAEFTNLLFDGKRNIVHLASIEAQSYVCYDYVQSFSKKPIFRGDRISSSIMTSTKSHNGRELIVTTGTINAVNAHHGGLLVFDEVDLMPKSVFNEAHGMITSSNFARGAFIYISSRKEAYGNIQDLLNLSANPNSGISVHRWGILEQCEQCTKERSGIIGTKLYINEETLTALSEEEYQREVKKDGFVELIGYKNCRKCGIFSFCKGKLRSIKKSHNPHYMPIEDVVSYFRNEDVDFFKSQRLSRKPSKTGLIYPQWEESLHLKTYAQMYEIWSKSPHPNLAHQNDIPLNLLIQHFIEAGCKFCLGVDWGFTDPFVALLMVVTSNDTVFVIDHLTFTGRSDGECIEACRQKWGHLEIEWFADTESPGAIKEVRNCIDTFNIAKWSVRSQIMKDVDGGIGMVRNFLRNPAEPSWIRLFVHQSIKILREEMKIWHYAVKKSDKELTDKPEDKNDHAQSALRYVLYTLYNRSINNISSPYIESLMQKEQIEKLNVFNNVTPQAVASKIGVELQPIQNDEEKDKKIHGNSSFYFTFLGDE